MKTKRYPSLASKAFRVGKLVRINFQYKSLKGSSSAPFWSRSNKWIDLDDQQVGIICASCAPPGGRRLVLFGEQLFLMNTSALEPFDA